MKVVTDTQGYQLFVWRGRPGEGTLLIRKTVVGD